MKTINNVDELCQFIIDKQLSQKQVNELLMKSSVKALIIFEENPIKMASIIKTHWENWQNIKERPIFIDVD